MTFLLYAAALRDVCFDATWLRIVANKGQNISKLVKHLQTSCYSSLGQTQRGGGKTDVGTLSRLQVRIRG
jgi:hypothetical protein